VSSSHSSVQVTVEPVDDTGQLARVTIDHASRLNVLNDTLIGELHTAFTRLSAERTIRCVVLDGAGDRAFIGGADIRVMAQLDQPTAGSFIRSLHDACAAIRKLPAPVIAKIRGYCLGAGLEVAASCDLRVASRDATFGMPEVRVGIPSVIEAALLPRLIGTGRTARLLYTGETIQADEAERWGLIDRVVPRSELDAATQSWVTAIVSAGPEAIRLQKQLIQDWEQLPLSDAIESGIRAFSEAYGTDEPQRFMQRFLNRKRR